jgi:hypothetical protein
MGGCVAMTIKQIKQDLAKARAVLHEALQKHKKPLAEVQAATEQVKKLQRALQERTS